MHVENDFLQCIIKKLSDGVKDEQTLIGIKDECTEFIAFLRKNNNTQLVKVLEDIPQIIEIAIEIKDDTIQKSCIRLIIDVLIDVIEYCKLQDI
jgi:hypothetical protein